MTIMDYGTLADEGGFFLYGFNQEWIYGHSSPHVISLVTDQDFSCLNPGVLEDPLNLAEIHQMQLQVQEAPVIQVEPAPVVLANNYTAEMNFISSLFAVSLKYGPPLYASDLAFARWKNTTPYSHRAVNLAKKEVKLRLGILPKESFQQKKAIIGVRIDYNYPPPPYGG